MANQEAPKTSSTQTSQTSQTSGTASPFPAFPQMPSFDPMAMWSQGQQAFQKMMTDAAGRWQSFADQYASIEQQVSTQAQNAVAHLAQLAKDAITYGTQLSAEARKLSFENAKKMGVGA